MRLIMVLFGLLFVFIGALPFLKRFLSIPLLPSEGTAYSMMVAGFGLVAIVIGAVGHNLIKPKLGLK